MLATRLTPCGSTYISAKHSKTRRSRNLPRPNLRMSFELVACSVPSIRPLLQGFFGYLLLDRVRVLADFLLGRLVEFFSLLRQSVERQRPNEFGIDACRRPVVDAKGMMPFALPQAPGALYFRVIELGTLAFGDRGLVHDLPHLESVVRRPKDFELSVLVRFADR